MSDLYLKNRQAQVDATGVQINADVKKFDILPKLPFLIINHKHIIRYYCY